MQVTGKVTVQFTRPAILHITLHMILPAIPLVISDIACPVVQHIVTGVLFQGFGDSPEKGTRPRSNARNAPRMCPRQLRLTCPGHRRNELCGTVPIRPHYVIRFQCPIC